MFSRNFDRPLYLLVKIYIVLNRPLHKILMASTFPGTNTPSITWKLLIHYYLGPHLVLGLLVGPQHSFIVEIYTENNDKYFTHILIFRSFENI